MKSITQGTFLTDGKQDYRIDKYIASGGFAEVYKATCNGSPYAIKVIKNKDEKLLYSLKNEFDIASKVDSDHAIHYYYYNEYGQNDYPCFVIMEYASDGTLQEELDGRQRRGVPYTTEELFDIYSQIIDGMIDISKVAVHRDIKPLNILISNGTYKISDYGLAKYVSEATRASSKTMKGFGSELYYAPELWAAPNAHGINDIKVDIYAMGIVFYQLANLAYPYDTTVDYASMHMTSSIKAFSGSVDPVFQSLIRKMMEKSKLERFDSWNEIKDFLKNSSVGKGIKRDPFVDRMLKASAQKKHAIDAKADKDIKEKIDRVQTFRRLVSQIQSKVYDPLKGIVESYNSDSSGHKARISEMEIDDTDETFSFDYIVEPFSEDDDERLINFTFEAKHTERRELSPIIPITSFLDSGHDLDGSFGFPNQRKRIIEYKYFKNRILLWGMVTADCGAGFNIAIFENPEDSLYGKLKTLIRTPNDGSNKWLCINSDMLKNLVQNGFQEPTYTLDVADFAFDKVEALITQNEIYNPNSIHDPFERRYNFRV